MKKKLFITMLVGLALLIVNGSAFAISFNEVPLLTSDPLIGSVQFFAGDPTVLNDTYTNDPWTPGNAYLANGYDDGTGGSPGLYDTFIGASIQGGLSFASVSLDILSEFYLPPSTTLTVQALSGGSVVSSASVTVSDNNYHALSVAFATGFDTVYIYDDLDQGGSGDWFHIDNFVFTEYTGGGPGPAPVPEPGTMLLIGTGLAGFAAWRRKHKIL